MASLGSHPTIEIVYQPAASHAMENNEVGPDNKNKVLNDQQKNKKVKILVPRIKIIDPQKRGGQLVGTCVLVSPNNESKYHVHSNKLSGPCCRSGVAVYQFQPGEEFVNIDNLYIKIVSKEKVEDSIANLVRLKIDPFKAGYDFDRKLINPDQLRLAFQAFLRDKATPTDIKKMVFTAPIVTNTICNNSGATIKIDYIENSSDYVTGGGNLLLIIENLKNFFDENSKKQELQIRFFDNNKFSEFAKDRTLYNNSSILVTVPPYNTSSEKDVDASIQVIVKEGTKETLSDIHRFTYKPTIKPNKRPIAYDDYYECEVQDSKNSVEISKLTRQKLAKRTKTIWSLNKSENQENLKIDLKLPVEKQEGFTMDLIGNNFLINYSNENNLHFLKPIFDSEDGEKMDLDKVIKNNLLEKIVGNNIQETKRIKHPTDAVLVESSTANNADIFTAASSLNFNENNVDDSLIYYNIEEIIDLFD